MTNGMEMKIGIIGLGYVGLQLAVAFGEKYRTVGFDLNQNRLKQYRQGLDRTGEVSREAFSLARKLIFCDHIDGLIGQDVYIIAVPTPVDESNHPDLGSLVSASQSVGSIMRKGALVVYESTVFPGATEDICVPELETASGLKWKEGFNVGYSPERINPGDKRHTLQKIVKVVAGDTEAICERLEALYGSIVEAGIYRDLQY